MCKSLLGWVTDCDCRSFEVNARKSLDFLDEIFHGDRNVKGIFGEESEREMKGWNIRKHRQS